ncbi:MAG: hypothetical protein AAF613_02800 [Pseudomonadota bacterium]
MDYQTWFAGRRGHWGWTLGLTLVFCAPALSGIIGRLGKSGMAGWGADFEAIVCAAQRARDGLTLYPPTEGFVCEGLSPANYLYTPWVAETVAAFSSIIPFSAMLSIYPVIFAASILIAAFVPVIRPGTPGTYLERAPFLGFATGSMLHWGNVASLLHSLIALSVRWPPVLIAAILLAGAVKPTYLTFLLVILLMDMNLFKRAAIFIAAAIAGLAPTVLFLVAGGADVTAWQSVLNDIGTDIAPGIGFLGWFHMIGITSDAAVFWIAYVLFAMLMVLSATAFAERWLPKGRAGQRQRIWLGLAVGTLINFRIMEYDMFLLAPGLVALVYASALSARTWRGRPIRHWLAWMIIGAACLVVFMNVADLADYAGQTGTFLLSAAILIAGLPEIRPAIAARPELGFLNLKKA